ncbi:MAG: dihydrolipoamide acetyltransferase family protein [Actinomycetota bacterium]
MSKEFRLPDLGEGLTEAEIVNWLVKEGEEITLNQPLVEVETEKALVEIPSPFAGTIQKLHAEVGQKVQVGSVIVSMDDGQGEAADAAPAAQASTGRREVLVGYGPEDETAGRRRRRKIGKRDNVSSDSTDVEPEAEELASAPAPQPAIVASAVAAPAESNVRALATPPVRKLAKDLGVTIDTLAGTGPGGRVTREDVMAAAQGSGSSVGSAAPAITAPATSVVTQVPSGGEQRIAVRAIRRSIAEKMTRSYSTIPHVTEWLQIDATDLMTMRKDLATMPEAEGGKISPLPLIVKALVATLRKYPMVNSSWDDATGEIVVKHYYNVGIATATERGLLVPVVRNADKMNVFDISREIARLAGAARDHKIAPNELSGSTITITNVGSFGMEAGTPIINHPEAAILCTGAIAMRPWVIDGAIVPRQIMTLGLSFDHRIIDGSDAGAFLRYLADLMEKPARLLAIL